MAIKINSTTVIDDNRNISSVGVATIGSGNSTTTIDGNTGVVNVGTGITIQGISGNISIAGTLTAGGFNIPASIVSLNPANGATNVDPTGAKISITFNQAVGVATTGSILLQQGSANGITFKTLGIGNIQSIPNGIIINPGSNLPFSTSIVPIIPTGLLQSTSGSFIGLNTTGADSYSFTTRNPNLGDAYEGGYLICASAGVRWVVAPSSSEVTRTWYTAGGASTRAQEVSGCTGWFLPTCSQLQNPGYTCRTYWDIVNCSSYWSSTQCNAGYGFYVSFCDGTVRRAVKTHSRGARAFRCVTY